MDQHRRAPRQQHHVRVGHPVGRRDHHLVARVDYRLGQVEEALLAAAGDQDLLRGKVEAILPLELGDHRGLEAGHAVYRGVLGEALIDRLDGRGLDVIRGVEVRLPGAQPDDVLAGGLEGLGPGIDGEGGGGLDGLDAGGELDSHFGSVSVRLSLLGLGLPRASRR